MDTLDPKMSEEIERALARRQLDFYVPYPKQADFHRMGGVPGITDRLLIAGNQLGKTWSAGAETAYHLTGIYPVWWEGYRFTTPVDFWASCTTSQSTRDAPQRILLGKAEEWGTGMIPGRYIKEIKKAVHGVSDSVETVLVEHVPSGKTSRLVFKTYDQGRLRWQGETLHGIWFDEEPPQDIYSEGKTRLQVRRGISYITFTPLLGMTEVVTRFLKEKPPGSGVVTMTIHDALHYTSAERQLIIAGYPEHERKARSEGIPIMGSGRVFPIDEELLKEPSMPIPSHWPRICGMDIGWDHPTAAVWMAWDRDTDTIHVYDVYRVRQMTPIVHAAAIKARGAWIPVAWPHDGLQHDTGSGAIIAKQYRDQGVPMLRQKATHAPERGKKEGTGGYGVEAGVLAMFDRMQTGRFKVASHLNDWFEEFRMYYRQEGLIVKKDDDLMSATRMGCMMLRFAKIQRDESLIGRLPRFQPTDSTTGVLG